MTIKVFDTKVTANEYAKWLLYDKMQSAFYFTDYDADGMTEREIEEVSRFLEKQHDRVRQFLGINKIMHKVNNDMC